eukprot:TRINITY_DN58275_c0_g1_i1.p1 TRINITY_DN58275_c0_g1~~TRINITY_DN58275_c0_g1_i1.p1  ORF type:complete len:686 (-),score=165.63 TRINITY_DN58275_c0_g1_i1:286-2343(-)
MGPAEKEIEVFKFEKLLADKLQETQRVLTEGYLRAVRQELQTFRQPFLERPPNGIEHSNGDAHKAVPPPHEKGIVAHTSYGSDLSTAILEKPLGIVSDVAAFAKPPEPNHLEAPNPDQTPPVMLPGTMNGEDDILCHDFSKGRLITNGTYDDMENDSQASSQGRLPAYYQAKGKRESTIYEVARLKRGSADSVTPNFEPTGADKFLHMVTKVALNIEDPSYLADGDYVEGEEPPAVTMKSIIRKLPALMRADAAPVNNFVGRFVSSKQFETVCSLVITCNAMFIAYASDQAMIHLGAPKATPLVMAEIAFSLFYLVELILRAYVYRLRFFLSKEWMWNNFDLALVVFTSQELIMELGFMNDEDQGNMNMSFLRFLRIMKMVKLFRIIRLMRMFRELRLIWQSIMGSMKAIFWAMMLIAVTSFMVGVCFLQATTNHLIDQKHRLAPADIAQLMHRWGSCKNCMLSLFKSVTNGADWEAVADVLQDMGFLYYFLFLFFILFFTCVVTNTLTSLFVETTMMNAEKDQAYATQNALENSNKYIAKLKNWFEDLDDDGSGLVSYEEFVAALEDQEAVAFASTLEIEITDLKQFFSILSKGGTKDVDVETFVVGCIKMRGNARSMDLVSLITMEKEFVREVREFLEVARAELTDLRAALTLAGFDVPATQTLSLREGQRKSGGDDRPWQAM